MGIENPVHLLFIALVALIVLGPKRLPALARALGQGLREFRGALEHAASQPAETAAPPSDGTPEPVPTVSQSPQISPAPAEAVTEPAPAPTAQPPQTTTPPAQPATEPDASPQQPPRSEPAA